MACKIVRRGSGRERGVGVCEKSARKLRVMPANVLHSSATRTAYVPKSSHSKNVRWVGMGVYFVGGRL